MKQCLERTLLGVLPQNPFKRKCANVTRLGAAVGGIQNAALVAVGKLPATRRCDHLRVGPHCAGGRVSIRPLGVFQPSFRTPLCYNCAFPTELNDVIPRSS